MNIEKAQQIAEYMTDEGIEAKAIEYSGRGMYGRVVGGIVCSMRDAQMIGYAAAKLDIHPADLPYNTDSMGRDVVYY